MSAWWVTGNTADVLTAMPADSVDLVLTSPPFLALRSYLPADDPAKAQEIGCEPTPGHYLDTLLDITEQLARVLAPHGSLAIELGDTYAGSGGSGGDYNEGGLREGQAKWSGTARAAGETDARMPWHGDRPGWPTAKSLCLIPELYRFALAYGFNPLTGRTTARWRIRNVIRWCRPNPPVGSLGDKFRPATSELVVACATDEPGRRRYFDLDAVRTKNDRVPHTDNRGGHRRDVPGRSGQLANPVDENGHRILENEAGAPPLDWWEIPTHGYKGAHYATWPPVLLERPIKAMCPPKVCAVCGQPSRRISRQSGQLDPTRPQARRAMQLAEDAGLTQDHFAAIRAHGITDAGKATVTESGAGKNSAEVKRLAAEAKSVLGGYFREFTMEVPETVGWTDCAHDAWRPGRILDPFAGTGTTGAVATGHGRDFIGIDLDIRNEDLARQRIGMWFNTVTATELAAQLTSQTTTTGSPP